MMRAEDMDEIIVYAKTKRRRIDKMLEEAESISDYEGILFEMEDIAESIDTDKISMAYDNYRYIDMGEYDFGYKDLDIEIEELKERLAEIGFVGFKIFAITWSSKSGTTLGPIVDLTHYEDVKYCTDDATDVIIEWLEYGGTDECDYESEEEAIDDIRNLIRDGLNFIDDDIEYLESVMEAMIVLDEFIDAYAEGKAVGSFSNGETIFAPMEKNEDFKGLYGARER